MLAIYVSQNEICFETVVYKLVLTELHTLFIHINISNYHTSNNPNLRTNLSVGRTEGKHMEHKDVKYRREMRTESVEGKHKAAIKVDRAPEVGCQVQYRRAKGKAAIKIEGRS